MEYILGVALLYYYFMCLGTLLASRRSLLPAKIRNLLRVRAILTISSSLLEGVLQVTTPILEQYSHFILCPRTKIYHRSDDGNPS
jgi:hypothetical protein